MMRNLLFAITLLCTIPAWAQKGNMGKSDPEAKKLMEEVAKKFKSYKTVFANFNLKVQNSSGKEVGSETGSLQIKGDSYRIISAGQQIYSDGKTIWTYDIADKEVQITNYDPKSDVITPQKMFTDFYDSTFLYKLNEETRQGARTIEQIELTPLDKTKVFFKLLVNIDKESKDLVSTTVFEKNGNRYIYTITSLVTNKPLEDSLFVFNPANHKNVEVVDLR